MRSACHHPASIPPHPPPTPQHAQTNPNSSKAQKNHSPAHGSQRQLACEGETSFQLGSIVAVARDLYCGGNTGQHPHSPKAPPRPEAAPTYPSGRAHTANEHTSPIAHDQFGAPMPMPIPLALACRRSVVRLSAGRRTPTISGAGSMGGSRPSRINETFPGCGITFG